MSARATVLVFMLALVVSKSDASTVAGWWAGQVGGTDVALSLKVEKDVLSGSVIHQFFYGPLQNATVQGHSLSFEALYEGNTIAFKGYEAANTLHLTMVLLGHELTGDLKRVKPGEFPAVFTGRRHEATEVYEPVPKWVDPGPYAVMTPCPSDAIVLFDGKDLSKWRSLDGTDAKWDVHEGSFTARIGAGDISTRQRFADYQLHIEWQVPADATGHGQMRGNSGVFLQDLRNELNVPDYLYEIQILDSYHNPTYVNGQAAAIYKQSSPLVNAARPPGQWNVYDVLYTAPRFADSGAVVAPARVTLLFNGVLAQDNFAIRGHTTHTGLPAYFAPHGKAPITLQNHGMPVNFRNIWIRER